MKPLNSRQMMMLCSSLLCEYIIYVVLQSSAAHPFDLNSKILGSVEGGEGWGRKKEKKEKIQPGFLRKQYFCVFTLN